MIVNIATDLSAPVFDKPKKFVYNPEMKEELHIQYNGTNDPGNYVGIVNLEDENGLVSSCIVRLEVRGNKPDYEINLNDFDHSMVYKGLVKLKTAHGAEIIDNNKEKENAHFISQL